MKITKLFTLALAAFAFAACSQDDSVTENMRKANITLHAPEFDADWSRTQGSAPGKGFRIKHTLNETTGMEFSWTQGDMAGVFAENDGQLFLKMAEGQDAGAKVNFIRETYQLKKGVDYVAYYPMINDMLMPPNIEVSYLNQEQDGNHSYTHLAQYDYMVSDPVTVQQTNTADFMFNHQGAILRLLIDMPEADTYSSVELSAEESIFTTKAVLNLFNKTEVIQKAATSTHMRLKLNNTETTTTDKQLEAWLMVSPVDFTTNKLTVTVKSATGKSDVTYTICPGKKFEKGKAYQIKLPGDAVDHSKNPLLKWAEYNLQYNKTTGKSEFATSYTAGGSLYQWGRNYGWTDYKDAMGTINSSGVYWYGTYSKSYDACTGWYNYSNGDKYLSARYTSSGNVRANPSRFLMNAGGEDYWVSSFGDGGSNWDERAEKCAFTTPLCPDGWRMPTRADFNEIWPKNGINTTAYALATQISNLGTELREIDGVCKYAIKWELTGTGTSQRILKISALVVPQSFTESMITSTLWNDPNVKVRYFGATGAIEAYAHTHTWYYSGTYIQGTYSMDIARPMPFGTWDSYVLSRETYYNTAFTFNYTNIVDAGKTYEGSYWASDTYTNGKPMIYRFRDNQGKFGADNTSSFFGASPQPAQNAFAIRCVKAE